MKQNRSGGRRLWKRAYTVSIVFFGLGVFLTVWTQKAEDRAHYKPDYPMEEIDFLLHKDSLNEAEQQFLFRQTGLGAAAVEFLYAQNRQEELLEVQKLFFAEVEVGCESCTLISREECIRNIYHPEKSLSEIVIPCLEEGDILITFNSHFLGWRNGHAAIVVDAREGLTLEARVLGTDSCIMSASHWKRYPSLAVLRLKGASAQERKEIAAYAAANMIDIPYFLGSTTTAGEGTSVPSKTQCAHLVWYAYRQFGYDLDSDGGMLVTPRDLYESPFLEIIQIYGMPFRDNS